MDALNIFSYGDIGFFLLVFAVFLLLVWNVRLERKVNRILIGGKPKNLEETLDYLKERTDDYGTFKSELEKYLTEVERRLRQSTRGIGMVRFNPFKGTGEGGNQSFATAFINENGSGVVVSTLYARDHVSVFAKPIRKFSSDFDLTVEEKEAISIAKEELKKES